MINRYTMRLLDEILGVDQTVDVQQKALDDIVRKLKCILSLFWLYDLIAGLGLQLPHFELGSILAPSPHDSHTLLAHRIIIEEHQA